MFHLSLQMNVNPIRCNFITAERGDGRLPTSVPLLISMATPLLTTSSSLKTGLSATKIMQIQHGVCKYSQKHSIWGASDYGYWPPQA